MTPLRGCRHAMMQPLVDMTVAVATNWILTGCPASDPTGLTKGLC
jgi:hypothetical protein